MSLLTNLRKIDNNLCKAKYKYKAAENAYFNPSGKFSNNSKKLRHDFDIKYMAMRRWEKYFKKKKEQLDNIFKTEE